jgi:fumarate reductase iron-sulfur subunit
MSEEIDSVSLLVRREIEASIAVPLIKAFAEELGADKAFAIAGEAIRNLGEEGGKLLADVAGGNQLEDLARMLPFFSQGGALEFEVPDARPGSAVINITRCRFTEMYKRRGMKEFGYLLSCGRDHALFKGFNPEIEFTRTQTIMEGADYCDFCLSVKQD